MAVRAETQIDLARVDDGSPGTPGQNGATFTPSVAVDGDISWTNDGGLPNPPTQNIMGPQGDPGTPGANGVSVTSVEPQYYLSTSDSSATGGSWSSTPATFVSGCYYWTRDYITFSDGTNDTSTEVYNAGMTKAAQDAYDAKTLADDTNQYFWYAPTGADTGAHITEVPQDEWNDSSDPNYHSGGNLLARSNGIAVRDGMTELATFGATGETIGITDGTQSYMRMDYHSMKMIDKNGETYFHVSDLRGANGEAELTYTDNGDGNTKTFNFDPPAIDTSYSVTVSDSSGGAITKATSSFTFASAPTDGATITLTYTTNNFRTKAYTIGMRGVGDVGAMSVAEGLYTIASGSSSHAEGNRTVASGDNTHAEGYGSTASGDFSHAEGNNTISSGDYSHAEGDNSIASGDFSHAEGGWGTEASGQSSHAEGAGSIASGGTSHAQNRGTIAGYSNQTAIGAYNNNISGNAFEIGNGVDSNNRSNALTVDWSGNIKASGGITVEDHNSEIGTVVDAYLTADKAVATSTNVALFYITLDKGIWIIAAGLRFPSNATGRRVGNISQTSGDTAYQVQYPPANGGPTQLRWNVIATVTADNAKYYLNAWQNSGSSMTMPASGEGYGNFLRAVRIA